MNNYRPRFARRAYVLTVCPDTPLGTDEHWKEKAISVGFAVESASTKETRFWGKVS
jgi:hypothetical protein